MEHIKEQNILIVEDEEDFREILKEEFEFQGAKVIEASNGEEALTHLQNHTVDLMISDVRMPKVGGFELLTQVKDKDPTQPMVLLITAFSDVSVEEAFHEGAEAIFSKPFEIQELIHTVNELLKPLEERWTHRDQRIPCEIEVHLSFQSWEASYSQRAINISRGGMFVRQESPVAKTGQKVAFEIQFQDATSVNINGEGFIRWVRTHSEKGLPTGLGIEFSWLENTSRKALIEWIQKHQFKSYVPHS